VSGPDFLIVGAMKCGTSTLQAQLVAQAGVFMTTPKEPNYFSDDDIFARGPDWYAALFQSACPGDLKGEASTHYTKLPTYPETLGRLAVAVPVPKLIYLIRNPLERAVSHYIHEWSEARIACDLAQAVDRHPEIVDYGRYGMQIAPFAERFGANSVHLMSLERLTAEPQAELVRVGAFLGLAGQPVWQEAGSRENVSSKRVRPLPFHGLLVANPVAAWLRRALVPKAVRARIRKSRSMQTRPDLSDDLRRRLEAVYLEDRARLAAIFPDHAALTDSYPFAP
jgi:hypothetical protein